MKTKLFIAAAVAALSLGATGAQALTTIDVATPSTDSAVQPVHAPWYTHPHYGHTYCYVKYCR